MPTEEEERAEAGRAAPAEEEKKGRGMPGEKLRPRSTSVVGTIVVNFTVLMFTALALIAVFVNWTYSGLPAETAMEYAPYIIIPYIIIFGLTVAVYGWYLLSRTILRPLNELLAGIRQVWEGDLSYRVKIGEENEFGQLARAFNEMAAEIERSRAEQEARIEELKELNVRLAQAQREVLASEKLASVGRLAAGVAHEIGNPLAAVAGYLDLLARRDYLREAEQEIISRIQKENNRINEIIRELLDYSRPAEPSFSLLNINDSIHSTLTLLRAQKGFDKIELQTRLEEVPRISANRSALQQVLMNLILNALQAMPQGGRLEISTRAAELHGAPAVELTVADTGVGIPAEHLDKIFDPFFTTKEPGQGTGLGLSICQRIVENMKGQIRVESEEGKGTRFTIFLPVERKE